jgi:hypothetical protein
MSSTLRWNKIRGELERDVEYSLSTSRQKRLKSKIGSIVGSESLNRDLASNEALLSFTMRRTELASVESAEDQANVK